MNSKCSFSVLLLLACMALPGYAQQTLREATKGKFLIGVALNSGQIAERNPVEAQIVKTEFSSIVAENCMKSAVIHPEEKRYNFDEPDRFVALGERNGQAVIGHCLIWHSQLARWFCVDSAGKDVAPEVLKERMREHIYTIVRRYKGRVKGYDVVNEAFEDNGSYRNSKFYQILGKDFIRLAFQYAHEADPDVELYYNDYNMATPSKCDAVVAMVKELKAAGCRIDAVGMQGHMSMDDPSVEAFETSIRKLSGAGVKVMVTEWDISILPNPYSFSGANVADRFRYSEQLDPYRKGIPAEVQQKWDQRVRDMFALFLKYSDVIDRVTLWGLNDGGSWKNNFPVQGRQDSPLFFDRANQRKPVVSDLIRMAAGKP